MKTRYILLAFAALAMSGCARNVEPTGPEGIQMTFTAYQEGSAPTKTTVLDGGTQVYWETSEEIKVFYGGAIGRFISQNTENVPVTTFIGTINVVAGANEGSVADYSTWGLYPYRADATCDGSSVTTTLPSAQTGRAGSFAKKTNITVAQSNGLNLPFYNVCGGVRFSLTQEGIKRVTFEGNNVEALAGKIKIAFEDGVPVVSEVIAKDSVLTLTAPGGGTFQTGVWYYLSALPGPLSGGYKMVFYKESEYATRTSTNPVTIKRGIFGSLANADDGLVFTPTGSGDDPDDVIQFADPIAKSACVEKFDTGGDNEVSYAEAAAATSLTGLFTDWNTVTSFDEIRYFTGVTSTSGVFDGLSNLKSITIPEFITTLGSFRNCTSLESVVLPSGLTSLPSTCFDGCKMLSAVTLPEGITAIPNFCFRECDSLNTLALPSGVTSIGNKAFDGCDALVGVEMPSGLRSIGNAAFQNCGALSSVTLSSGLVSIGSYAFSNCTALGSIAIPSGVNLGAYAFNGCSSLMTVSLPSYLPSLPNYCFQNCTALASIALPDNLQSIGQYAFSGCSFAGNNYSLELPSTVTTIGDHAFGNLRHLIIPSNTPVTIAANSFVKDYTYLYVPADMVEMYKSQTNWSEYADRIRPIGDYPVSVIEAVDLGLSVKWASCNVGALDSSEYGDYFAWGETATKTDYSWSTYLDSPNRDGKSFTKYFTGEGGKATLDLEDDAAHVNWGGTWRMPTDAEWTELRTGCTWTWTTRNGVSGSLVTAPNGNSIFLPAAGLWYVSMLYNADSFGNYWSSSLYTSSPENTWTVKIGSGEFSRSLIHRYYGLSVRPVTE